MNTKRKTLMITSILITFVILGFIVSERGTKLFQGLNLFIFTAIIVIGAIVSIVTIKKNREKKAGLTIEDELSIKIKYKAGYFAYLYSMYMWLFIFLFKDKFPNIESMLGGGVLLSAIIFGITKFIIKKEINDKE
ncbi:MAG: hypothetical protein GXO80_06595 [Chlorobi bacterium]|nr:hypothetical protein [Chlorobiota bacterium]